MAERFFRVVSSSPPTPDDFRARRPGGAEEGFAGERHIESGISVFATLRQARRNARSFPSHGAFIAELVIPDEAEVSFRRTGRQPGHHTVWASSNELLAWVTSVLPA